MAHLQQAGRPGFELKDAGQQAALVDACLADRDHAQRDGLALSTLSQWMRNQALAPVELARVRWLLYARWAVPDVDGFGQPFAALVLPEVARTDRVQPWMTTVDRAGMVERAASYMEGIRDYRGFTDGEGWRHGVAHGADWLMQLALDPAMDKGQLRRIVPAVDRQLMPDHA